jgi:hypothetical protein
MVEKELELLSIEEMQRFKDEYPALAAVFLAMVSQVSTHDERLSMVRSAFSETSDILKDYDWKLDALKLATDKLIKSVDPTNYERIEKEQSTPLHVMPFFGVRSNLDIN